MARRLHSLRVLSPDGHIFHAPSLTTLIHHHFGHGPNLPHQTSKSVPSGCHQFHMLNLRYKLNNANISDNLKLKPNVFMSQTNLPSSLPVRCFSDRDSDDKVTQSETGVSKHKKSDILEDDKHISNDEDAHIRPALEAVTPNKPPEHFVEIVPGKGPPPEPPVDCCMSGCANCVWIQYAEELAEYFSKEEGIERVKKEIEKIENPGLQMFLKLELGLL